MNILRKCTRCDKEKPESNFQYKDKIGKMCEECRIKNREITKKCRDKKKKRCEVVSYDTHDTTPTEKTIPTDEIMTDGTYTETTTITIKEKDTQGNPIKLGNYKYILIKVKTGDMYGFNVDHEVSKVAEKYVK